MDTKNTQKILIAIPSHNESETILKVVNDINSSIKNLDYSLVVFDDASKDNTQELLKKHNIENYLIKESFGLGYVFSCITKYFLEKKFDILLTIDGDGQFNPKDIENILKPIMENSADMVTGSRFMKNSKTQNISFIKKIGNKVGAKYISSILKKRYYDVTCGFRSYSRKAILKLHTFSDFTYTQEVFLNLGFKKLIIKEIPIHTEYFTNRKSKMTGKIFQYIYKSIKIILKSMLIYSPMRLFGGLSLACLTLSLFSGTFVFFWDMSNETVTPFKWLAITSLILGSLAIFLYCVGILLQITSRLQLTNEEILYYQKVKNHNS